jgi:hypothetical protein
MAERQLPKLIMRVRSPSPAPSVPAEVTAWHCSARNQAWSIASLRQRTDRGVTGAAVRLVPDGHAAPRITDQRA